MLCLLLLGCQFSRYKTHYIGFSRRNQFPGNSFLKRAGKNLNAFVLAALTLRMNGLSLTITTLQLPNDQERALLRNASFSSSDMPRDSFCRATSVRRKYAYSGKGETPPSLSPKLLKQMRVWLRARVHSILLPVSPVWTFMLLFQDPYP